MARESPLYLRSQRIPGGVADVQSLSSYVAQWGDASQRAALTGAHAPFLVESGVAPMSLTATLARDGFRTGEVDIMEVRARHLAMQNRQVFVLEKRFGGVFSGQISVGRTPNVDIRLSASGISKFHAYFSHDDAGNLSLTDNDSRNGTFINGERLTPHMATPVGDGLEVRFASAAFRMMSSERFAALLEGLWEMRE